MIDQFLDKMNKVILPKNYSINNFKNEKDNYSPNRNEEIKTGEFPKVILYTDEDNLYEHNDDMKKILINEKKKNMNLRYQVYEINKKVDNLNKKIEKQTEYINKLEKQKESDSKYLLKLENMFNHKNDLNQTIKPSKLNISQQTEETGRNTLMKLLMEQNDKLKKFQDDIFKISKKYDQMNDTMSFNLGEIHNLLQYVDENITCDDALNTINYTKGIISNIESFNKIIINMNDLIETKQSEYILLLTEKEAQLESANNEIINLKETIEILRTDRMRDQQFISQLQNNCTLIEARLDASNIKSKDNTFVNLDNEKVRAQV
jgi:chromosome segregation ATPase